MSEQNRENLKKMAGVILIALGIPGLILPIIPGIVLIIVGLSLLGNKHLVKIFKRKSKQER